MTYTFLDYVFGKCELLLVVAIDFTKSNGSIHDPKSLHHLDPSSRKENEYIEAIKAIGEILLYYDSDKMITVLGFGAKVPPLKTKACHCFSLTGNIYRPEVFGIEGILQAYRKTLAQVEFSGPTHFAEIVKFVNEYAEYLPVEGEQ